MRLVVMVLLMIHRPMPMLMLMRMPIMIRTHIMIPRKLTRPLNVQVMMIRMQKWLFLFFHSQRHPWTHLSTPSEMRV
jgi:hypothetical protein